MIIRRKYSKVPPITAAQARMKSWGRLDSAADEHLQNIYKLINIVCGEYDRRAKYHHTDTDENHRRICRTLREGGYDLNEGWNKKQSRWEIEINW